jgi:RNA polymerase sigma factor (sigma-70 family)
MQSRSEDDRKAWRRIEELFKLRADLQENITELNACLHTVKIEEVDSILYEALVPQVRAIIYSFPRVHWSTEAQDEVANEAIRQLLHAYGGFQGRSSLRTYCTAIVKNVALGYLKKQQRERNLVLTDEEEITRLIDQRALDQFTDPHLTDEARETAERVLEELDFDQLRLTDKEFVAVVIKLASQCLLRKKLPDEELASKLGMKRTTFTDSFARGRTKICQYLKEKETRANQSDRA